MFLKYVCPKCGSKRFFSVKKDEVLCTKCNEPMVLSKGDISINVMTTEEARFVADEALFNTVGDRVSNTTRVRHC